MNSLKYINKQIKKFEDILLTDEIVADYQERIIKKYIKELKQVKRDLEAWHAVKRNLEHPSGDTDILAFCISLLCIDQMEDYKKILKALKVKDNA